MEFIIIILIVAGAIGLVFYLVELIADILIWILGLAAVALTLVFSDILNLNFGQTCILALIFGISFGIISIPVMPYTSIFGKRFSKKTIKRADKTKTKEAVDKILEKD